MNAIQLLHYYNNTLSIFYYYCTNIVISLLLVLLYVHRNHKDYEGQGAQDGHLDFHTAPEL